MKGKAMDRMVGIMRCISSLSFLSFPFLSFPFLFSPSLFFLQTSIGKEKKKIQGGQRKGGVYLTSRYVHNSIHDTYWHFSNDNFLKQPSTFSFSSQLLYNFILETVPRYLHRPTPPH